jgi:hypothetical protein
MVRRRQTGARHRSIPRPAVSRPLPYFGFASPQGEVRWCTVTVTHVDGRRQQRGRPGMRYRDKDGARQRESTLTEDRTEAQRRLRERRQARYNNTLPALRRGQDLNFWGTVGFYLENFIPLIENP